MCVTVHLNLKLANPAQRAAGRVPGGCGAITACGWPKDGVRAVISRSPQYRARRPVMTVAPVQRAPCLVTVLIGQLPPGVIQPVLINMAAGRAKDARLVAVRKQARLLVAVRYGIRRAVIHLPAPIIVLAPVVAVRGRYPRVLAGIAITAVVILNLHPAVLAAVMAVAVARTG